MVGVGWESGRGTWGEGANGHSMSLWPVTSNLDYVSNSNWYSKQARKLTASSICMDLDPLKKVDFIQICYNAINSRHFKCFIVSTQPFWWFLVYWARGKISQILSFVILCRQNQYPIQATYPLPFPLFMAFLPFFFNLLLLFFYLFIFYATSLFLSLSHFSPLSLFTLFIWLSTCYLCLSILETLFSHFLFKLFSIYFSLTNFFLCNSLFKPLCLFSFELLLLRISPTAF